MIDLSKRTKYYEFSNADSSGNPLPKIAAVLFVDIAKQNIKAVQVIPQ